LEECIFTHFDVFVNAIDFNKVGLVFCQEVDFAIIVHDHWHGNSVAILTDDKILEICLLSFFDLVREFNGFLTSGCDAVEDDTVVVLIDKCHVNTSCRLNLDDIRLEHDIVSRAFIHASLVLGYPVRERHGLCKCFAMENVQQDVAFLAIITFVAEVPRSGQERDVFAGFFEGDELLNYLWSLVKESDILELVVVREADEV
jgi:hypothetical protein